jgi:hypothetical protein
VGELPQRLPGADLDTRTGTIDLAIPKLRSGSYFPDWLLEQRRRSERALVAVVAECYVRGAAAPTLRCAAVPADPAPAPGLPSASRLK